MVSSVLLIDDNKTDNFINKRIIELAGFAQNIFVKQSAQEALTFLKENAEDHSDLPKIIFLDINMPVMNGFEFIQAFENCPAEVKNHCKIVVLSSSNSKMDVDQMSNSPYVIKYLIKPLSKDSLASLEESIQ
ncbi:response regulator [Algivirga pacifica]|uniref:Response regulator n=1 Tax=Algivirga pacifica TaxID=1162670 RepID=A0ABP9CUQ3_9BACT